MVAYAIAGRSDVDFRAEPLGEDDAGAPVYLRDIWPSSHEIQQTIASSISSEMFRKSYEGVFEGDARWRGMEVPAADRFEWDSTSTYVQNPPYFDDMSMSPRGIPTIRGARMLALLGDSITTDHISPAGAIKADSPAGHFLQGRQIPPREFNLLRLEARQPRDHDAGNLRQHPPAQPGRARHRGRCGPPISRPASA